MNTFTVSFFGHRQLNDPLVIDRQLDEKIRELILSKEYIAFLVGRDGEFDQLAVSAIRRAKRAVRDDNSALILVLPYVTAEYKHNTEAFHEYYDEIEICTASSQTHFKAAHRIRNQSMIDRSDLVVFCVQHPSGGAYQAMKYASRVGKHIINLSEEA